MSSDVGRHPLIDLEPFDPTRYDDIDLDRLTAYGVRTVSDRGLPVTFENVVMALFRLFPGKFALHGFPEYPDAARVNRAILHCFPKYRNYLAGSARSGYRLSHQGELAADEAATLLSSDRAGSGGKRPRPRGVPRSVAEQLIREVIDSPAFARYQTGERERIRMYDVARLLHASPDGPRDVLVKNMKTLMDHADAVDREDAAEFLEWAAKEFGLA